MTQFASNDEFHKLTAGRTDVDLVQLMLDFAADAYDDLDRVGCLMELDRLGVQCADAGASDATLPLPERLAIINRTLSDVAGFHGNREDYYDPRNSYLNDVLARRTGLPITLGIVYIAVASRASVPMFGVNTPGHFVVAARDKDQTWYVDAFSFGGVLDQQACARQVERMTGDQGVVCDSHFCRASAMQIGARVLRNLKVAYAMLDRWPDVLVVQQRLTALLPDAKEEQRDLGLAYLRAGEPARALGVLEPYLSACPRDQAEALAPSLQAARRMMAERN